MNLDKNWDAVSNGDSVRKVLGTVYSPPKCSVALCSFSVFTNKFVQDNYDDFNTDDFETISADYLEAINQADFLAYSSLFSEYGNGGGVCDEKDTDTCKRVSFLDQSRGQIRRAAESMKRAISFLNSS